MNRYLRVFVLSIIYYLIYLFVTLQLIPFLSLFTNSANPGQAISLQIGPLPIGYLLMLFMAIITNFGYYEIKARRKLKDYEK